MIKSQSFLLVRDLAQEVSARKNNHCHATHLYHAISPSELEFDSCHQRELFVFMSYPPSSIF